MPTGIQGAAYFHNLPEEGSYIADPAGFNLETERNDMVLEQRAFTGLGGAPIRQRISNVGILAKLRLLFVGQLVVSGAGAVTSLDRWPWNLLQEFTLGIQGQTGIISCEGMDLRARRQRMYRNPRDHVSQAPATDTSTIDPNPGVIANGTYTVVLAYDIPITHDDLTLTGAIFAQSDAVYLDWRAKPAAKTELFSIASGGDVAVTGTIHTQMTFFDIPTGDTKEGRKVLIPDLRWLHGYLSSDAPLVNTGNVKTPFIRNAGQLLSYTYFLRNGATAVIDPAILDEVALGYGGNREPRNYSPAQMLLEKNAEDYNGRILPKAGCAVFDFEVDNPPRDLVYPKGVTELNVRNKIPTSVTLLANSQLHFVEETLFSGV